MTIEQFVAEATFRHIVTQGREAALAELLGEYLESESVSPDPTESTTDIITTDSQS